MAVRVQQGQVMSPRIEYGARVVNPRSGHEDDLLWVDWSTAKMWLMQDYAQDQNLGNAIERFRQRLVTLVATARR